MASALWRPGRRLFSIASILMLLTAAAHTAGHFTPSSGPAEDAVLAQMRGFVIPLGFGMAPSLFDILNALTFTMSVTFVALGALNLVIAASADAPATLLRRVVTINVIWVAAFLVLSAVYQITPSLISGGLIEVTLIAALLSHRP